MNKVNRALVGGGTFVVAMVATAAQSLAAATYDISPVTTGFTSDVTSNLGVILPLLGGLIALGVVIGFFRKHAKAK